MTIKRQITLATLLWVSDVEEGGLSEVKGSGDSSFELLGDLLAADGDCAPDGVRTVLYVFTNAI